MNNIYGIYNTKNIGGITITQNLLISLVFQDFSDLDNIKTLMAFHIAPTNRIIDKPSIKLT